MADKISEATITNGYVVETEIDGFSYTMDYAERSLDNVGQGTSPTGMLLVSLSGCHLMTATSYLNLKKIDFSVLKARVEGDFIDENGGWKLGAQILIETDAKLTEDQLASMDRFIHRHCKVSSILSKGNDVSVSYELI